jgi:hypothetical protein
MNIEEQYHEAYEKAPKETKRVIESFQRETKALRDKKPLLYYILGSGTPPYKMSKEDSKYVDKASGRQNCSNCIFTFQNYVKKTYICSQIRGTIKLGGWCKLWAGDKSYEIGGL